MVNYKNLSLDPQLAGVIRHMHGVEEYREVLQQLQAVWDNLTLLGQLSGAGSDMSATRQAFNQLTGALLNQLGMETLRKSVLAEGARAQVAIDILVRNLYERTADIGFLATDHDIVRFLDESARQRTAGVEPAGIAAAAGRLRARFADYVAKYSVYSDIVLLDTKGEVLVRLDPRAAPSRSQATLIGEALETRASFVEYFGSFDLTPDQPAALVYASRVQSAQGATAGVLCLLFRFEDEMQGIFAKLGKPDDAAVLTLIDPAGRVLATADPFHIPTGAPLPPVTDCDYRLTRFAAQEYISVSRRSHPYQGYLGPGWLGHVMLPVQHAFDPEDASRLPELPPAVRAAIMSSSTLFSAALRDIPVQAELIQRNLSRSVWNGSVRQGNDRGALNPAFAKVLLWEISNTGARTKDVFGRSIENLHQTVVSAILQNSRFRAGLAIDIMDRNLYERANDCRWWAMTSAFRELLAGPADAAERERTVRGILEYINSLYTVYSNLVVFDADGCVVAASHPDTATAPGTLLDYDWVRPILALRDGQAYAVSDFRATPLYGDRPTYIYGAAIRAPGSERVIGGVAIVFDAAPQFSAMLQDALPRDAQGLAQADALAAFAGPDGRVIACSDARYAPGAGLLLEPPLTPAQWRDGHAGVVALDGRYYAIGVEASHGYREYKSAQDPYRNDVAALVLVPLCDCGSAATAPELVRPAIVPDRAQDGLVEIATFAIAGHWYGLRSHSIVESVDATGMTVIPGAARGHAGLIRYQGDPLPVFDLRHALSADAVAPGVVPAAGVADARMPDAELPPAHQVVVVRRGNGALFGLLVDALGEIPQVRPGRLTPLPAVMGGGSLMADAILAISTEPDSDVMLVLGADRVYAHCTTRGGAAADQAPATAEPLAAGS